MTDDGTFEEERAALCEAFGLDADGNPPALHPDLVPFLVDSDFMGQVLKHPLVFQVPYAPTLAGSANKAYAYKRQALDEAREAGRYATIPWLHERPYRLGALAGIADRLSDADYWSGLSAIWIDTENMHQNAAQWRRLLGARRPGRRKHFMDADEQAVLRALKGPVTIYRGTSAPDGMGAGLSWTLDADRAAWFARRLASIRTAGDIVVLTGTVPKARIIAYMDGRNEREIVVFPEHVTVVERRIIEE